MTDPDPPPSLEELDTRLRAARAREREVREGRNPDGRGSGGRSVSGLGVGMRLMTEIVVGFGVGAAIGWQLDVWLGTKPWLMLVWLVLGGIAGIMNAYRQAKGLDGTVGLGAAIDRRNERRHDGDPDDAENE